jgi:hypothetical protein
MRHVTQREFGCVLHMVCEAVCVCVCVGVGGGGPYGGQILARSAFHRFA